MTGINIINLEHGILWITIGIICLLCQALWVTLLRQPVNSCRACKVLTDAGHLFKLLVSLIKSAKVIYDCSYTEFVFAEHPEAMILDLTVGVSQEFKRAIPDRNAIFEPIFDLTIKEYFRDLLIVEVFAFLLIGEHIHGVIRKRT